MATIKGENLRVMVGDDLEHLQCIAAATNCVLHCALQVEESTTKDTEDDWIVNEPVGLNWDMQVESLVISDDDEEYRPGAKNIDQLQVVDRFSHPLRPANHVAECRSRHSHRTVHGIG